MISKKEVISKKYYTVKDSIRRWGKKTYKSCNHRLSVHIGVIIMYFYITSTNLLHCVLAHIAWAQHISAEDGLYCPLQITHLDLDLLGCGHPSLWNKFYTRTYYEQTPQLTMRNSHQISRNLNLPLRTIFQYAMDISKSEKTTNKSKSTLNVPVTSGKYL